MLADFFIKNVVTMQKPCLEENFFFLYQPHLFIHNYLNNKILFSVKSKKLNKHLKIFNL